MNPLRLQLRVYGWGLLTLLAMTCSASPAASPSFTERVAQARAVEKHPDHATFFQTYYPVMERTLGPVMLACMKHADASSKPFTLVADLTHDGQYRNVAYAPATSTARCLAEALPSLQAPAPPVKNSALFPIVIDMSVTP